MIDIKTYSVEPMESNCYIITDYASGDSAAIDPGLPKGEAFDIACSLGSQLKYILITHGHFDHVMGAAALKRTTGAEIAIHKLDKDGLESEAASMFDRVSGYYDVPFEPVAADILLEEGSVINLGKSKISVINTPGHTDGSVCFICDGNIFTGDTLFRDSMGRIDFPTGNAHDMMKSLIRLAKLDKNMRVYPGHDRATTIGREAEHNYYIKQAENGTLHD